MSGYTKGPWHVSEPFSTRAAGEAYTIKHDRRDRMKWNGYVGDVLCSSPNAEANARLMAAAPDMLEALQGLVAQLLDYERVNNLAPQSRPQILLGRDQARGCRHRQGYERLNHD